MAPRRLLGDDRLARLAAEGDERAFARIYERHHQGLYRYCRSILRNEEDAADALQNTMVKALRALPGESRDIALKPWLYRIAHNEAISLLRRRSNDHPIDDTLEIAGEQDAASATRERLRSLISDLAELPERQRGALVMRELSGLSYDEIGAALDSSPGAAKQSVYEAREALHRLAEGRSMDCEAARRLISANDRRILRGRKLRAHLRSCERCRGFERALTSRGTDLGLLAPPLSAPAAASVLEGILGGGGGGSTGGGVLGALAGTAGNTAAGSAALKATTAAVTVALGVGGAYEVAERGVASGFDSPFSSSRGSEGGSAATSAGADGDSGAVGDRGGGAGSPPATSGDDGRGGAGGEQPGAGGAADSESGGGAQASTPVSHVTPPGLVNKGGTPPGLEGGAPPGPPRSPPGLAGGGPPGLEGGAPPGLQGGGPPGLQGGGPPGLQAGGPPGLQAGGPPGLQGGGPPRLQAGGPPGE